MRFVLQAGLDGANSSRSQAVQRQHGRSPRAQQTSTVQKVGFIYPGPRTAATFVSMLFWGAAHGRLSCCAGRWGLPFAHHEFSLRCEASSITFDVRPRSLLLR